MRLQSLSKKVRDEDKIHRHYAGFLKSNLPRTVPKILQLQEGSCIFGKYILQLKVKPSCFYLYFSPQVNKKNNGVKLINPIESLLWGG
jgi:hypothetical protein